MNRPREHAVDLGLEKRVEDLEEQLAALHYAMDSQRPDDCVSLICFSGEWDRLFAAFSIAAGALAMGQEVHMFFTFWAVSALRREGMTDKGSKSAAQNMLARMLPAGPANAPLSKMHCWGLGKSLLNDLMKQKGVDDIDTLFAQVRDLGAQIHICDTSAQLFGITDAEIVPEADADRCGVATFLSHAMRSRTTLFV